jgi:hypothetical protein
VKILKVDDAPVSLTGIATPIRLRGPLTSKIASLSLASRTLISEASEQALLLRVEQKELENSMQLAQLKAVQQKLAQAQEESQSQQHFLLSISRSYWSCVTINAQLLFDVILCLPRLKHAEELDVKVDCVAAMQRDLIPLLNPRPPLLGYLQAQIGSVDILCSAYGRLTGHAHEHTATVTEALCRIDSPMSARMECLNALNESTARSRDVCSQVCCGC